MNFKLPNIRRSLQTFWGFLTLSLLFLGLAASIILVTERQEIRKEAARTAKCNETCLSAGYQCASGLECIQLSDLLGSDKCRNPECPKKANCICPTVAPTPIPTPIECQTLWWWDNEHPRNCNQKEFCGEYMYLGLQTSKTKPEWCKPSPSPSPTSTPSPSPTVTPTATPVCWLTGDFNCDGEVDLLDFEIFRDIYVDYL